MNIPSTTTAGPLGPLTPDTTNGLNQYRPAPAAHSCPHCGYCPHCGRSDHGYVPPPRWPGQPYWWDYSLPSVTVLCSDGAWPTRN